MCGRSSLAMPSPSSETIMSTLPFSFEHLTVTVVLQNLKAFDIRFETALLFVAHNSFFSAKLGFKFLLTVFKSGRKRISHTVDYSG